jgi:2,4-dienoyl-CoA reductase-like NADH-dependent reductase (Old Yellow Enzyme family)
MMSRLFSPLVIKGISLKNRITISPMCQYSARDGFATDWHLVHLGSRAVGGAGLVIQEATAISPEGRITPYDLGIYKEEHLEMLRRITSFIKQQNSIAGIQLAHAGRKASTDAPWYGGKQLNNLNGGWQTMAPSAIPFYPDENAPVDLTSDSISKVIRDFQSAAKRALQSGYEVLEIHAAHGYLIHQFLSPLSNHRTDDYGGSFENRIRLLLEVIDAVQRIWPENLPIFVRISATDWVEGGWDPDQSIELARILLKKGIDLIDCSSGGLLPHVKIPLGPGYQVPFSERIKKETGIKTGAVGLITKIQQAEEILEKDQADLIFLARLSLREPYFPLNAAKVLNNQPNWPVQYKRAID